MRGTMRGEPLHLSDGSPEGNPGNIASGSPPGCARARARGATRYAFTRGPLGNDSVGDPCCFSVTRSVPHSIYRLASSVGVDVTVRHDGAVPEYIELRSADPTMCDRFGFRPGTSFAAGIRRLNQFLAHSGDCVDHAG
jgi:hypothetical protein